MIDAVRRYFEFEKHTQSLKHLSKPPGYSFPPDSPEVAEFSMTSR